MVCLQLVIAIVPLQNQAGDIQTGRQAGRQANRQTHRNGETEAKRIQITEPLDSKLFESIAKSAELR